MSEIINISCPGCQTVFEVPDEMIGQTVECPQCNATFEIAVPEAPEETAPGAPAAESAEINTACPGCQAVFEVPASMMGESVDCPQCGVNFKIEAVQPEPALSADQTSEDIKVGGEGSGEYTHTVKMSRTSIGMVPVVDDSFNLDVVGQHIQKSGLRKAFESGEYFVAKKEDDESEPGEEPVAPPAKKKWWQALLFWKK